MKADPERLRPLQKAPPPKDLKSHWRAFGLFSYYSNEIPDFPDRVHPVGYNRSFSLPNNVKAPSVALKNEPESAVVTFNDSEIPLGLETDGSNISALTEPSTSRIL